MADVFLGLDLGKRADFSALAVLYRSLRLEGGLPARGPMGEPLYRWRCPHLRRWPRGTPYTEVVGDLKDFLARRELPDPTRLVVDATGVGSAVVEMLRDAKLPKAHLVPLTITAGGTGTHRLDRFAPGLVGYWVAKAELASAVQAALSGRTLKVDGDIPEVKTLAKELANFEVKVTKAANQTFEAREGEHDDLVLALALPLWVGARRRTAYLNNAPLGLSARETAIIAGEAEAEAEALHRRAEADRLAAAEAEAALWGRRRADVADPVWWRG
jgi:hypothetical protein